MTRVYFFALKKILYISIGQYIWRCWKWKHGSHDPSFNFVLLHNTNVKSSTVPCSQIWRTLLLFGNFTLLHTFLVWWDLLTSFLVILSLTHQRGFDPVDKLHPCLFSLNGIFHGVVRRNHHFKTNPVFSHHMSCLCVKNFAVVYVVTTVYSHVTFFILLTFLDNVKAHDRCI